MFGVLFLFVLGKITKKAFGFVAQSNYNILNTGLPEQGGRRR